MAREGTRSATGNSRPRVFPTVAEPAVVPKKRASANTSAKRGPKKAVKGAKPVGVQKTPAKKPTVATKAKGLVKKAEGAITKNPAKKAEGTKKVKAADGKSKAKVAKK